MMKPSPDDLLMIKQDSTVKLQPFLKRYSRPVKLADRFGDDQYVRQHTNQLLIFGISNSHRIVQEQLKIDHIIYRILDNDPNKLIEQLSGKKKSKSRNSNTKRVGSVSIQEQP